MFIAFGFWEEDVCSGAWALQCREQTHFILFFFPLECSGLRRSLLGVLWVPPCPVGWLGRLVCLFGVKHLQLWRQRCGWVRGTSLLDGDSCSETSWKDDPSFYYPKLLVFLQAEEHGSQEKGWIDQQLPQVLNKSCRCAPSHAPWP